MIKRMGEGGRRGRERKREREGWKMKEEGRREERNREGNDVIRRGRERERG